MLQDDTSLSERYFESLSAMAGFDKLLAANPFSTWDTHSGAELVRLGLMSAQDAAGSNDFYTKAFRFTDTLGKERTVIAARDAQQIYIWLSKTNESKVEPSHYCLQYDPAHGRYSLPFGEQQIYNNFFPYPHQAHVIDAYLRKYAASAQVGEPSHEIGISATGTGKSHIVAHVLKGLGGVGVVIAPKNLGGQIAKDLREVMPSPSRIEEAKKLEGSGNLLAQQLRGFQGVLVIEESDLHRFIGSPQAPGWLCSAPRKHVCIDEAHEFTMGGDGTCEAPGVAILQRIAASNDVLAVTATPTNKLYEALSIPVNQPAFSMTMYDAMHVLPERPFRPLALEMKQVGQPVEVGKLSEGDREQLLQQTEPTMRKEVLAGYFGREEYIAPDYYHPLDKKPCLRTDVSQRYASLKDGLASGKAFYQAVPNAPETVNLVPSAIVEAMKKNRVRYSTRKHIGFAIRPELLQHVTEDLQAIHEGSYDISALRELTQEVWKRRAQSAIAEYIRMYASEEHDHALPAAIREIINRPPLDALDIRDDRLSDVVQQQKYNETIRKIDPEMFRRYMPELFQEIIGKVEDIDLTQDARQAALNEAQTHIRRKQAEKLLGISDKAARELDLSGELFSKVEQSGKSFESEEGAAIAAALDKLPTYYAVNTLKQTDGSVKAYYWKNGEKRELPFLQIPDNQTGGLRTLSAAETVTYLVRAGRIMHVMDNYELTTGFSDPDVMITTRIVERIGDHLVRATQILGRPIRAKDSVAAVNELVSPLINLQGERGVDRHFSCYDVVAKDYLNRCSQFLENWKTKGQNLWQTTHFNAAAAAVIVADRGQERGGL